MTKPSTYQRFVSFALATVLLLSVACKELHHLLEHDHEAVAHCAATGNETHLHGEEYHPEDCFVCDFHFAPAIFELQEFVVNGHKGIFNEGFFTYHPPFSQRTNWHFQLRGPPTSPS